MGTDADMVFPFAIRKRPSLAEDVCARTEIEEAPAAAKIRQTSMGRTVGFINLQNTALTGGEFLIEH